MANGIQTTVAGNLTADPELAVLGSGASKLTFSIACERSWKNDKGEWVNNTQWFNLVAWNTTAGFVERNVQKGYELMVEGKLVNKSYDAKDGTKRYVTEIEVSELMIVNKRTNSNS
jgi:single-strand DNA-binding protein